MSLVAHDLHLSYGSTVALAGASVAVPAGEVVALVGPSGSGKTSLLYCLSRLLRPDSGSVTFENSDLTALGDADACAVRRSSFGFVFQFGELVPELSILENVALPLELLRRRRSEVRARVAGLLEQLGIADVASRRPDEVSGGEVQRAAVARAIVHRPAVIFADEPTGALDAANGELVLAALTDLARQEGAAIAIVTHDRGVAAVADRQVRVHDGRCHCE